MYHNRTYMAVVHPDAMAVVPSLAFHDVVGVIRLGNLIVGVDNDLEKVHSVFLYVN